MPTLAILGSGTAIPHPRRGASGYAIVTSTGEALLLECGPGSTRRWPAHGITFESARAIAVTHHHVDHCCELAAVLFGRNVPDPPVSTPLSLLGPVGHRALIAGLEGLYGSSVVDPSGARETVELADRDARTIGPFSIAVREVRHARGALGIRVACEGRTFAFSGDSAPCDALVDLATGVDLALFECSYPSARESKWHLNSRTAAQTAVAAGVTRLVLTHFYPQCDEVDIASEVREAGYGGELVLAEDGMAIAF